MDRRLALVKAMTLFELERVGSFRARRSRGEDLKAIYKYEPYTLTAAKIKKP